MGIRSLKETINGNQIVKGGYLMGKWINYETQPPKSRYLATLKLSVC